MRTEETLYALLKKMMHFGPMSPWRLLRLWLCAAGVPLCLVGVLSCSSSPGPDKGPGEVPSVYYWRTTWHPSAFEQRFCSSHNIGRIYLRLFDVVARTADDGSALAVPEATLHFDTAYSLGCEVVPVVFVEEKCLLIDTALAGKIVRRVWQFCQTNDLVWHELQIDCDWVQSRRGVYFNFLADVRRQLNALPSAGSGSTNAGCNVHAHANGNAIAEAAPDPSGSSVRRLSATIRLHQLLQPAPPLDYGVLMCYNTGDVACPGPKNAVLDTAVVQTYASRGGKGYSLPLVAAYPVYRWCRLFRDGAFVALVNSADFSDSLAFEPNADSSAFAVRRSLTISAPDRDNYGVRLLRGDTVWQDVVRAKTIASAMRLLRQHCTTLRRGGIIYSLNEKDIKRYNYNEIETILDPCR